MFSSSANKRPWWGSVNNPEYFIACEQGKGKERGKMEKEACSNSQGFRFPNAGNFMFKLTILVASTTTSE